MGLVHTIGTAIQDVRHGVRVLRKSLGFAAAVVLTVALGVGATTAVFSLVYAVVLRPLPYSGPDRLVNLWSSLPSMGLARANVAAGPYRDWRAQNHVFDEMALVRSIANFNLIGEGEPERLQGARVTASLFRVLGIQPIIGRAFREDEEQIGENRVVLLSHGLWKRRFGQNPEVVGRAINLSGVPHVVIGVMPSDFHYPAREFELWTPLTIDPEEIRVRLGYDYLSVARLKRDKTLDQAQAEMNAIAARLALEHPVPDTRQVGIVVSPMLEDSVGGVRRPLSVLFGAVGFLLLIGCANVANLLMARTVSRGKEFVVRAALGASRMRLVLQSVAELLPMILLGGLLGIEFAAVLLGVAIPSLPAAFPKNNEIEINAQVLLFSAAVILITALAVGIWPALQIGQWNIAASLRQSVRHASMSLNRTRLRDALLVFQIAVAVLLSIGAMLLIRSFAQLKSIDPGFGSNNVLTMQLAIPRSKYPEDRQVAAFCASVLERVQALPGVKSAGMVNRLPLAGIGQINPIEFQDSNAVLRKLDSVDTRTVTPDYFRTLRIPLLRGRVFRESDNENATPVGIIDQRIAERIWPNEDPIGKRFRLPFGDQPWLEIVGIVGHIRHDRLDADMRPQAYFSSRQRPQDRMALVISTEQEPIALGRSVAAAIRQVDPEQPVYDVRSMQAVVDESVSQQWLTTTLLTIFASVALVLATIGVYGVVSYSVGQRTQEIGIRIALGAQRRAIMNLILRRCACLTAAGVGLGVVGAFLLTRVLGSLLYSVRVTDGLSFISAACVLALIALIASYIPTRRAVRVDPMMVLRLE